jgi:hypothetical protein
MNGLTPLRKSTGPLTPCMGTAGLRRRRRRRVRRAPPPASWESAASGPSPIARHRALVTSDRHFDRSADFPRILVRWNASRARWGCGECGKRIDCVRRHLPHRRRLSRRHSLSKRPASGGLRRTRNDCPAPAGLFRANAGPPFRVGGVVRSGAPSARQYREAPDWQGQSVFGCPVQWP